MKCFSRHTWARKRFEESIAIIGEPALPGPRCNQHLPWIITSQVFYELKIRFYITEAHKKYAIKYPVIILFVWKFVYMYFCIDKLYLLFQSYLNQNQIRIRTNNNDMIFFPSEFRQKLVVLLCLFTSSGSGRNLWHEAAGWSLPLSVSPYLRLHGFYDNPGPTYDCLRSTCDNIIIIRISKHV